MGQPGIAQGERRWYLISRYGDLVVRVHSNMSLGESASGELSFDPIHAQLELDIDDDGGLVLRADDDHELEPTDGTRCRQAHLARHRRAEIHLPNNVLRIDTDFVNLAPTDDSVAILAVKSKEDIIKPQSWHLPERVPIEPVDAGVEALPPRRTTSRSAPRDDSSKADIPLLEPMHGIPLPLRAPTPEPDEESAGDGPADLQTEKVEQIPQIEQTEQTERAKWTDTRRQHIVSPLMAALIGLAGISFALLLYLALSEDPVPQPPPATVSDSPAPPATPAAAPSNIPIPSPPTPLPASQAPPAAEPDDREAVAERLDEPVSEPGPAAESDIEQIELPPVERRSIPPVGPTVAQTLGATETAAELETIDSPPDATPTVEPEEIDRQPDVTVAAEPEAIDAEPDATVATEPKAMDSQADTAVVVKDDEASQQARAQDSEQARRRTLRAADVALEQGRLTTPPEASAYTLYNRVLALDPESPEARSGLQSVRQGLINRALAQLASDALDDARKSLQAAADTGANPLLVGDLLREVDYRQQLINARGGAGPSP